MLQRIVVDPAHILLPKVYLAPEQQHYLSRVLRLSADDRVIVMDGQGRAWTAKLVYPPNEDLQAEVLEAIALQTELPIFITLVMALPKGNAFDDVVRQVTELGVSCIAPVLSDRTLLNPSPQKLERWRRITQEAAEQSERQMVPTIQEPITFKQHLEALHASELPVSPHYLCVTRHTAPHLLDCLQTIKHFPPTTSISPNSLTVTIGPEGGWTETEIEQAIAAGYQPVSLGSRILRTVTAPIVALALIAATWEQGSVKQESFEF